MVLRTAVIKAGHFAIVMTTKPLGIHSPLIGAITLLMKTVLVFQMRVARVPRTYPAPFYLLTWPTIWLALVLAPPVCSTARTAFWEKLVLARDPREALMLFLKSQITSSMTTAMATSMRGRACTPGQTRPCFLGLVDDANAENPSAASQRAMGICSTGEQSCLDSATWGNCEGRNPIG